MKISHEELLQTLSYDPHTGVFHWIKPRKKVVVGSVAGTTDKRGYRVIRLAQKNYFAHRLAWLYVHGEWPSGCIDHANHDKADNRIENLRDCTNSENGQNRRGADRTSQTGVLGVSPQCGKFIATIFVSGQQTYLGRFPTVAEASAAYNEAKRIHHPFARTA